MSVNRWTDNMWPIHTTGRSATKRTALLTPATPWMTLEDTMLSEVSRKTNYDPTDMRSLDTSHPEAENRELFARGAGERGAVVESFRCAR